MRKWEVFENYLNQLPTHATFNSITVAHDLHVSRPSASQHIRAYLAAQRQPRTRTAFVLSRQGRTTAAVWHAGVRSDDARTLVRQMLNDIATKINDALAPDLNRIADLNPRAAQLTGALEQAFVAGLNVLAASTP